APPRPGYLAHREPRREWGDTSEQARVESVSAPAKQPKPRRTGTDAAQAYEAADLNAFFARLERAADHYDVLNVGRLASAEEIKDAYHSLAHSYHPDLFHQSEPQLRDRIDSAFARIAQAYETLSNESPRAAYDRRSSPSTKASDDKSGPDANRAESSFQRGQTALQQNRPEE